MRHKIQQIIYDMRHQPVIASVTFIATALSIFLVMVMIMMQQAKVMPFPPESCRDRLLIGHALHTVDSENGSLDQSAGLGYETARKLYADIDGVERLSYFTIYTENSTVKGPTSEPFDVESRNVDGEFFKIFDHQLIAGRFFTKEESDALMPLVVISESTARRALGDEDKWIGAKIIANQNYYTVVGVVRDNPSLATSAYGDLFYTTGPGDPATTYEGNWERYGRLAAALLVKEGVDFQHIRDQVKARYAMLDAELAPEGRKTVYHESPFDKYAISAGWFGSNITPDPKGERNLRFILYAIMLIVPAINLSSMLHSRLRRRISEIGVRRAYGCTRRRIITDIVAENFLITIAGGVVGVALSVIFAATYSGLYEDYSNFGRGDTPALTAVLNVTTIAIALGICFILNIISASVPAWQASRVSPVDAINTK